MDEDRRALEISTGVLFHLGFRPRTISRQAIRSSARPKNQNPLPRFLDHVYLACTSLSTASPDFAILLDRRINN